MADSVISPSFLVVSDISYTGRVFNPSRPLEQTIDFFLPTEKIRAACRAAKTENSPPENIIAYEDRPPLLLLIHGGLWVARDKSQLHPAARAFAEAGFAVAAVNYRLSPEKGTETPENAQWTVRFPSHNEDVAAALQFLLSEATAAEYSYDRSQVFLFGHSCGAHIVSSLALKTERFLTEESEVEESFRSRMEFSPSVIRSSLRGIIGIQGLYDLQLYNREFPAWVGEIAPVFEGPSDQWESPVEYSVHPEARPALSHVRWLILHSPADSYVNIHQPEAMCKFLRAQKIFPAVEFAEASGAHYEAVELIGTAGDLVRPAVLKFARNTMKEIKQEKEK